MTTVVLVMLYGQSRIIFAMSRDGLVPSKFSEIHPKYGTPFFTTWAIGIIFGLIAAVVPLNVLAELMNIGTLAAFCLVSFAVIVLRKKRPDLPRAFKCPLVPLVPALAIIFCITLMSYLKLHTWIAFAAWLLVGAAIYFLYAKKHSKLNTSADGALNRGVRPV